MQGDLGGGEIYPRFLTQALTPMLRKSAAGEQLAKVINIASIAGKGYAGTSNAAYAASKGAVIGLTRTAAQQLGPHNINVNAICPATIRPGEGQGSGMVLGLQGYYTLNRFGSDAFLGPMVALALIKELGPVLTALMVTDEPENGATKGADYWLSSTDQIIVSKSRGILDAASIKSAADVLPLNSKFPLWTDDFYNLLGILKR